MRNFATKNFLIFLIICNFCGGRDFSPLANNLDLYKDNTLENLSENSESDSDSDSAEDRIVGGYSTTIEKFPYMAQVHLRGASYCGGSILSKNWVLTAGHCSHNTKVRELKVRVGTTQNKQGGVLLAVKKVQTHKKYNDNTLDYDVGVLQTTTDIKFNQKVKLIPLVGKNEAYPTGTIAVVSGWGYLVEASKVGPLILQALKVPLMDYDACKKMYKGQYMSTRMVCAGYKEGKKDACTADSGGPLAAKGKQYGIVSWGVGCARPRKPGVYTRINDPEIRSFIKDQTGV